MTMTIPTNFWDVSEWEFEHGEREAWIQRNREYSGVIYKEPKMAKLSEMLPSTSTFLKADDIPEGKAIHLFIDCVKRQVIKNDEGEVEKPVLYFAGKDKGLVLNRTNLDTLVKLFGDDADILNGREIVMYRTFANFRGQTVPAIRLRGAEERAIDDIPF